MLNKNLLVLLMILLAGFAIKADVPPSEGYQRVKISLVFETNADLSKYRLFVNFAGMIEEVKLAKSGRTTFQTNGGGARFASGSLFAVEKKNLAGYEDLSDYEKRNKFSQAIMDEQIKGIIQLGSHTFTQDLPKGKKAAVPLYVITKSGEDLKFSKKKKSNSSKKLMSVFERDEFETIEDDSAGLEVEEKKVGNTKHTVIAGLFLAISMFLGGFFIFRKAGKKS